MSNEKNSNNIFIGWSGLHSHKAALLLWAFIPKILDNGVKPWVSSEDIAKGTQWNTELTDALNQAFFGIICLTKVNCNEPWIRSAN